MGMIIQKRVNPKDGIFLKTIEKTIKKNVRQVRGGLLKITKDQFDTLYAELDQNPLKSISLIYFLRRFSLLWNRANRFLMFLL